MLALLIHCITVHPGKSTQKMFISYLSGKGSSDRVLNNYYTGNLSSPVIQMYRSACLRISISSISLHSTFVVMLTYLKAGSYQEILLYRSFGFSDITFVTLTVPEVVADDHNFVIKFNFITKSSGSVASVDDVRLVDGKCQNPGELFQRLREYVVIIK